MLKTIILVLLCILTICAYFISKSAKGKLGPSLICAGASVVLLIATILVGILVEIKETPVEATISSEVPGTVVTGEEQEQESSVAGEDVIQPGATDDSVDAGELQREHQSEPQGESISSVAEDSQKSSVEESEKKAPVGAIN